MYKSTFRTDEQEWVAETGRLPGVWAHRIENDLSIDEQPSSVWRLFAACFTYSKAHRPPRCTPLSGIVARRRMALLSSVANEPLETGNYDENQAKHELAEIAKEYARLDGYDVMLRGFESIRHEGSLKGFLSGIGAALAGSMANKSSIVIDLRGWRTPSVSGEELQALGKSGPRYTAEIARGLPVPRG